MKSIIMEDNSPLILLVILFAYYLVTLGARASMTTGWDWLFLWRSGFSSRRLKGINQDIKLLVNQIIICYQFPPLFVVIIIMIIIIINNGCCTSYTSLCGPFHEKKFPGNSDSIEIQFGFHPNSSMMITTIFLTSHESCAAERCRNVIVRKWITKKTILHRYLITMEKLLVKWPLDPVSIQRPSFPGMRFLC